MSGELAIAESIDKRLKTTNFGSVFPLSPTHRKELRVLRDTNVGNLNSRLSTIRTLKREEYVKKYEKKIEKELQYNHKLAKTLNKKYAELIKNLSNDLNEFLDILKTTDTKYLTYNGSYYKVNKAVQEKDNMINYYLRSDAPKNIAIKEFKEQYGEKFDMVQKKIDDINTKYEEAINFGDLNLVKELYYIMKSADKFFDSIANLKV